MASKYLLVILLVSIADAQKKKSKFINPKDQIQPKDRIKLKDRIKPKDQIKPTDWFKKIEDRKDKMKPSKKNEKGQKLEEKVGKLEKKNNGKGPKKSDRWVSEIKLDEIIEYILEVKTGNEMYNITCSIAEKAQINRNHKRRFTDPKISDQLDYFKCNFLSTFGSAGNCLLTEDLLCDGISACSTDECACEESHVFYCSNGEGCVALNQVCDGQKDCLDGSDECVCDSYLNCENDRCNSVCRTAQQRALKCGFSSAAENKVKKATEVEISGLFQCMTNALTNIGHFRFVPENAFQNICERQCKQLSNHCSNIDWSSLLVDSETGTFSMNYTCGIESFIALSADVDVCDGFYDCPNRVEEASCANRFYCDEGSKSIPLSKVCDSSPDCGDLTDECQQCARNNLADDKFMISNKYISYYMIVLFFFVIVFNLRGIYGHAAKLYCTTQRYSTRVNSILCLQLCIYDLLMGIYILIITAKNFQFYGSYCIHDVQWRSSTTCNVVGVIFTFSSHGSLMTALIMGLYRCYACEHMTVYFSPTKSMIGLALANILIFLSSVVTLFPIQYFETVFVTAVSFEGNPIVKKGTKTIIDALIHEYYGTELDFNSFSWSDRLARLSNMTSNPEIFKPTGKFGFFNQSPLCIQNLFSDDMGDGIKLFKLIYVTTLGVIIILFSVSYIWIAVIRLRAAVPSADKSQKATKEKNDRKTSKKVAFIISSQLLAWIPIIIATILSYCNQYVPQDFYEIAAIILIPVNSLLNPLFHSPRKSIRNISKEIRTTQQTHLTSPSLQKTSTKEFKLNNTKPSYEAKDVIELSNMLVGIDVK